MISTHLRCISVSDVLVDRHVSGAAKEAVFEKVHVGWKVAFEGNVAIIFDEQPEFEAGDLVKMTLARV